MKVKSRRDCSVFSRSDFRAVPQARDDGLDHELGVLRALHLDADSAGCSGGIVVATRKQCVTHEDHVSGRDREGIPAA